MALVPVLRMVRAGLPVLGSTGPGRAAAALLRRDPVKPVTVPRMRREDREPATPGTTRPVRLWLSDAQWVRREAFERAVPAAVLMSEVLTVYREHTANRES